MTTLQKPSSGAACRRVGSGIYQARQISKLREHNQTLQQQQTPLTEQLQHLTQSATTLRASWLEFVATKNGSNSGRNIWN